MRLGVYIAGNRKNSRKKAKGESRPIFPKIEYPKEVKLLDELNEANKEEYKKWLSRKLLIGKILGKSTLIIGVKGDKGKVL